MDWNLPSSCVHGILQARILEWVAFPSPGDLLDPGTEPGCPALQADSLLVEPPGKPHVEPGVICKSPGKLCKIIQSLTLRSYQNGQGTDQGVYTSNCFPSILIFLSWRTACGSRTLELLPFMFLLLTTWISSFWLPGFLVHLNNVPPFDYLDF